MTARHTFMHFIVLLVGLVINGLALPHHELGASTSRIQVGDRSDASGARKLTGRFLHVTDIHPDPYYKTYSSTAEEGACHRGNGPAGIYGAETSACDAPVSLLNATFKWIKDNIKDDIDFIIWTGDSARHDNDENIPRSENQVVAQNELVVNKFLEVFGKSDSPNDPDPTHDFVIPIIPTFGNNDILPHNIFTEGPNKWTQKYLDIWRQFIPEEQRHQFQRGGWFYVEAIPNQLAIFSINTLYFFDSNAAADGCASKNEPGFEQFEWLRIQLQILRERGMKAILTGHVPPARVDSKMSWDETCWQKYTLWQRQYKDIIVGSFYGHMNIDHFMLQDFKDIKKDVRKGLMPADIEVKGEGDADFSVANAGDYLVDLRDIFAKIPVVGDSLRIQEEEVENSQTWLERFQSALWLKSSTQPPKNKESKHSVSKIGGEYAERYSLSFVNPSVVPNYFPTIRVYEYNITGLGSAALRNTGKNSQAVYANDDLESDVVSLLDTSSIDARRKGAESNRKKTHKFKVPLPPSKSSPPGPAYSPQTLSLLGYTQYYANLTHINNDFLGESDEEGDSSVDLARWKPGHHSGKVKEGKPHPKTFKFQVEYNTSSDKIFGLKDLTVRSYVDLAKKIAMSKDGSNSVIVEPENIEDEVDSKEQDRESNDDLEADKKHKKKHKKKKQLKKASKAWLAFVKRAFVGTMDPTEIESYFGKERVASREGDMELEL